MIECLLPSLPKEAAGEESKTAKRSESEHVRNTVHESPLLDYIKSIKHLLLKSAVDKLAKIAFIESVPLPEAI